MSWFSNCWVDLSYFQPVPWAHTQLAIFLLLWCSGTCLILSPLKLSIVAVTGWKCLYTVFCTTKGHPIDVSSSRAWSFCEAVPWAFKGVNFLHDFCMSGALTGFLMEGWRCIKQYFQGCNCLWLQSSPAQFYHFPATIFNCHYSV